MATRETNRKLIIDWRRLSIFKAQYRQVWELRANLEERSDFHEMSSSSPEPDCNIGNHGDYLVAVHSPFGSDGRSAGFGCIIQLQPFRSRLKMNVVNRLQIV